MKKSLFFGFLISFYSVVAQNVNIPDPGFKNLLVNVNVVDTDGDSVPDMSVDTNNDGEISVTEASLITNLDFVNTDGIVMNNIIGIGSFSNLESIINLFAIKNADFSGLVNLKRIQATYSDFSSYTNTLIITGCTSLEDLDIVSDVLTSLDLTGLSSLLSLKLDANGLTSLDISNQLSLVSFYGFLRNITAIDFSNNTNLTNVRINNLRFNIRSVDFQNLTQLRELHIGNTFLNTLDLNSNSNLEVLSLTFNRYLPSINVSSNALLNELVLTSSPISTVDLTSNSLMENLRLTLMPNINNNSISLNTASVLKVIVIYDVPNLVVNGELPFLNRNGLEEVLVRNLNNFTDLDLTNIPDLKQLSVWSTGLTNLNTTAATNLEQLSISSALLNTIDLSVCTNLNYLRLSSLPISSLDLSLNSNLENLRLSSITTPSIDLSHMTSLKQLSLVNVTCNNCSSENIFDLSMNAALENVMIEYCPMLTSINLTSHPNLNSVRFGNNISLETVFLKNNFSDPDQLELPLQSVTNPIYICVDDGLEEYVEERLSIFSNVEITVNSYCSFNPGGEYNEIQGLVSVDINANGCDTTDPVFSNFMLSTSDGITNGMISTNSMGEFYFPVQDGQYSIIPEPENPSYWNFTPANSTVDFPNQPSPVNQDFCVTSNGSIEDLEVFVVPVTQARPGFDARYKVILKNKGNQISRGTVALDFQNDFMTLVSAFPAVTSSTTSQLMWSFTDLQPFQIEEFLVVMILNTPTAAVNPLMSDDILNFTVTVLGSRSDNMPADNTATLNQTVVNSYDPNDKTCLEGKTITPAMVGEYVHYIIRFENTGTASAINVVVKDIIDTAQFDRSTFIPLGGSHDYYTRITENNKIEFIHENINLDFNDATNDGYILFKIKTLNTLMEGDAFDNTANIFFDFNAPIITNTETVTVMSTAGLGEVTDTSILLYPNPATDFVNINAATALKSITVLDVNGRMISQTKFTGNINEQRVELALLTKGIYFITTISEDGQKTDKMIIK